MSDYEATHTLIVIHTMAHLLNNFNRTSHKLTPEVDLPTFMAKPPTKKNKPKIQKKKKTMT